MTVFEFSDRAPETMPYDAPKMRLEHGQYGVLDLDNLAEHPLLDADQTNEVFGLPVPTLLATEITNYKYGHSKMLFTLDVRGVAVTQSVDGEPYKELPRQPGEYSSDATAKPWRIPADTQFIMVGQGWRRHYIDAQGVRRPSLNRAPSDREWCAVVPGQDFHFGAETMDQSGRHEFFFQSGPPHDNFTMRIDDHQIRVADGESSPVILHYGGLVDPNQGEILVADSGASQIEAEPGQPEELAPVLGSSAIANAASAELKSASVYVSPVGADTEPNETYSRSNDAGGVAETTAPETTAEDRQALEGLYAHAQDDEPSAFNAALSDLIDAGQGAIVIDNLPMLVNSNANAGHIAGQLIDRKQDVIVLQNFGRLVAYGADSTEILERVGSAAEQYFADDERAYEFVRNNLQYLQSKHARDALLRFNMKLAMPDDENNLWRRTLLARRIAGGESFNITYLDSADNGRSDEAETDEARRDQLFSITPEIERSWPISDRTVEDATKRLDRALAYAPGLSAVINRYMRTLRLDDRPNVVHALRSNVGLRLAVGDYLMTRANDLAHSILAPERLRENTNKSVMPGYPVEQATSREYAAMLALAMLDGTYDADKVGRSDQAGMNPDGSIRNGNHRIGAEMILGIWRPNR